MSTFIFILTLFIGISIIAFIIWQPIKLSRQRKIVRQLEFPKNWENVLKTHWRLYQKIPDLLKQSLRERISLFLSEKRFEGCQGFKLNHEHKLLIAAQACLLIINKPFGYYDRLHTILVYPSVFRPNRSQTLANGVVTHDRPVYAGEAWESGKIILSWDDSYAGLHHIEDGHNVVLHEFAHLLDNTNGNANGAPALQHSTNYSSWSSVFSQAYARLQQDVELGHNSVFSPYGATNPAEFFAVATEVFFEKSRFLQKQEPELYEELTKFYSIDPRLW